MQFEKLYTDFFHPIYRYSFRLLGSEASAEDITQKTFLQLYSCIHSDNGLHNPKAWLYRVASNLCFNSLKRDKKFREISREYLPENGGEAGPEKIFMKNEQHRQIFEAIGALKSRDQILIHLYQEGMTYSEISEITNIKKSSVGKILSRAIDRCARNILR